MNKKETRKLKVYGQSGTDIKMPLLLFSKAYGWGVIFVEKIMSLCYSNYVCHSITKIKMSGCQR